MSYIGIFDSGVGGLGIFQEIKKLLPKESIIYLADSANCPYGEKSTNQIKKICKKNCEFLIKHNAKIIVIACNSASVSALNYLRAKFPNVPIIGVVPVVKTAAKITKNKRIGILATKRTIQSKYLRKLVEEFCPKEKGFVIYYQAANELVEIVEDYSLNSNFKIQILNQIQNSNVLKFNHFRLGSTKLRQVKLIKNLKFKIKNFQILKKHLKPFIKVNVDVVALGCTHFPFLGKEIQKIMGPKVTVLDSNGAVARQVKRVLTNNKQLSVTSCQLPVKYEFYTSGKTDKFRRQISNLIGIDAEVVFSIKS